MKGLPKCRQVEQSISALARQVTSSLEELSLQAARFLSRGDCTGAERAVEMGRSVSGFRVKVEQLRNEWRALRSAARPTRHRDSKATPVWQYYQVIAEALANLGGEAAWGALEKELQSSLEPRLTAGDLSASSRGIPRWKLKAKLARKPMIREGFLQDGVGRLWKITEAGRQLAEKGLKSDSDQ